MFMLCSNCLLMPVIRFSGCLRRITYINPTIDFRVIKISKLMSVTSLGRVYFGIKATPIPNCTRCKIHSSLLLW